MPRPRGTRVCWRAARAASASVTMVSSCRDTCACFQTTQCRPAPLSLSPRLWTHPHALASPLYAQRAAPRLSRAPCAAAVAGPVREGVLVCAQAPTPARNAGGEAPTNVNECGAGDGQRMATARVAYACRCVAMATRGAVAGRGREPGAAGVGSVGTHTSASARARARVKTLVSK